MKRIIDHTLLSLTLALVSATGCDSVAETIPYESSAGPESLAWGPTGIFAAGGNFLIADNKSHTFHELSQRGTSIRTVNYARDTVGIIDIAPLDADIVALDLAAAEPTLVRFDSNLAMKSRSILPLDASAISGIAADDQGILVELRGGEELYRVLSWDDRAELEKVQSYRLLGLEISIEAAAGDTRTRIVHVGSMIAKIHTQHQLVRAEPIQAVNDSIYLLVEDLRPSDRVEVSQTVWQITLAGEIAGVAEIPINERHTAMPHGVAIDAEGRPMVLISRETELELRRLELGEEPMVTLEETPPFEVGVNPLVTAGAGCITSAQIIDNALEYIANSTSITNTSIVNDATCAGRIKPQYLNASGTYLSVSYDWGGFDTPTAFNTAMATGKKAGNLSTAGSGLSCSYGVDCSGFVSRAWGLTTKYSTSTLPNVSLPLTPVLRQGDILNLAGSHVVLFGSSAANGLNAYEATAWQNFDRVVHVYRPWSTLTGYQALRSNKVCP